MQSGRGVAIVNAAVATCLVVLVAAVALVVRPPAPPGIASLAPQARKAITKAPKGQTAGTGAGTGECSQDVVGCRPRPLPTAAATSRQSRPPQAGVPSALQCYQWPSGAVTQTFDPQSPPCVASWPEAARGNGGATAPGVTSNTIVITVGRSASVARDEVIIRELTEFFNRHFELYGRRLVVKYHSDAGVKDDPSAQRAAAARAQQLGAFAAVHGLSYSGEAHNVDNTLFLTALAQHKIIGINALTTYVPSVRLASLAPYAWTYQPAFDDELRNTGELACRALAGRTASHAGDATLRTAPRSFVILYPRSHGGGRPDVTPLQDTLKACGTSATAIEYTGYPEGNASTNNQNVPIMVDLKSRSVTTPVVIGSTEDITAVLNAASRAGYHPEWLDVTVATYASNFLQAPPEQRSALFGIAPWNKALPRPQSIPYRAFSEVDQGRTASGTYLFIHDAFYKAMLLIASGIQAAGPHLTPQTFAAGLRGLDFPNPELGGAPHYQGTVGFTGDHSMVDDFGLWWFNTGERNNDDLVGPGSYCYVGRGVRFRSGTWPADDRHLFEVGAQC